MLVGGCKKETEGKFDAKPNGNVPPAPSFLDSTGNQKIENVS